MFRIRNGMAGILTVNLEEGSIHLRPGQSFDIEHDGGCSRKWINSDVTLNRFLKQKTLTLVHDSKEKEIKTKFSSVQPKTPTPTAKPIPSIIDFGNFDDSYEEPEIEDLAKVVATEEPPELEYMTKKNMIEWAEDHNLEVDKYMRKSDIKSLIETSDIYKSLIVEIS